MSRRSLPALCAARQEGLDGGTFSPWIWGAFSGCAMYHSWIRRCRGSPQARVHGEGGAGQAIGAGHVATYPVYGAQR